MAKTDFFCINFLNFFEFLGFLARKTYFYIYLYTGRSPSISAIAAAEASQFAQF